jgi:hypothetical protein
MDEVSTLATARAVYETAAAFERAVHAAHKLGLRVDVRVEQIGDCTSTRQRPDLLVEVYQPLRRRPETVEGAAEGLRVYPADSCEVEQQTTHESLRTCGASITASTAQLGDKAFYRVEQTQYFKRVK